MPYTQPQKGLIGAALGAKKAGKVAPSYVPKSMAKLPVAKFGEMASAPTRKKIGKGHWDGEMKSAGEDCTVVEQSVMLKGHIPPVEVVNFKHERMGEVSFEKPEDDETVGHEASHKTEKMSKTQKVLTIGA